MVYQRKGLAERLWMLCKANVYCLDGGTKRFHDGEDQSVAEEEREQHVNHNGRVCNSGIVAIPLMRQDSASE